MRSYQGINLPLSNSVYSDQQFSEIKAYSRNSRFDLENVQLIRKEVGTLAVPSFRDPYIQVEDHQINTQPIQKQ